VLRWAATLAGACLVLGLLPQGAQAASAAARPATAPAARPASAPVATAAAQPASVTIAGSLQSELGCPGDWDPGCGTTGLTLDPTDGVWQGAWTVPAGHWEYKAAIDGGWDVNYGAHATPGGANITLDLSATTTVHFFYDDTSHWVTDDAGSTIVTAAGDFQSELGCPGDWQPDCLRSWLQDPDGDGIYTFSTQALPAGTYQTKAALNQGWDVNYGAGGVANGPNITFVVPADGAPMTFRYDTASHLLSVTGPTAGHDGNVEWDGLRHDSRDSLYRTPGGAVTAGTPVTLRLRTWAGDVTAVTLRLYNATTAAQSLLPMQVEAAGVDCYDPAVPAGRNCDFWSVTLPDDQPAVDWYRFIVTDGSDTDYYADDTPALDGGLGAPSDDAVDNSWALTVYPAGFSTPDWMRNAVIYQVFPDRFANGRPNNDPATGDTRYDDPALELPWGTLPEGYCRNYAGATDTSCPYRYRDESGIEQPTGRDYQGGDLKGVDQRLDYLQGLGVNTIYLNPIFDAGSDHGYDTQNYYAIDPYFGTIKDFQNLVKHAHQRGMRIILDGVFNHTSSDSVYFDRYHHYPTVGACESVDSPYRDWFTFSPQPDGPCAGPDGPNTMTYTDWAGFDSLAVLNKANPDVQRFFLTGPDSVAKHWLRLGADGWRLDVMNDPSFPAGYWQTFRDVVKQTDPDAVIIAEAWQKDSSLLGLLDGSQADGAMNYRLRDAVLGLLAPQSFDAKGFPDSGDPLAPSQFAARISSIAEDYAGPAQFATMNLLDSHDTERALWTLTPGAETGAAKQDSAALAAGKRRLELASIIQFSVPGAPTVYYGDEIGMTGDDDPDDRRAHPWPDQGGTGDTALYQHYAALAQVRAAVPALRDGALTVLRTDDATGVVSMGRKDSGSTAILVVNTGADPQQVSVPVAGYLPDGLSLTESYRVGGTASGTHSVVSGAVAVTVPSRGAVWLTATDVDLAPPAAPSGVHVTATGSSTVDLAWTAEPGAASYQVLVSPLSGGGYIVTNADPITGTSYRVTGLLPAHRYHIVVRALDAAGNIGPFSGEVLGLPHYSIGWANLQWPPSLVHTISATTPTDPVYGQLWIDGVTGQPGPAAGVLAQLGYGLDGSDPASGGWTWVDAAFNADAGNNDEYVASLLPTEIGEFDYAYRYSTTNGADWTYADLAGIGDGYSPDEAGSLTVVASADTTAPAVPTGLHVTAAGPAEISLAWDPVTGDPSMYGYRVLRYPDSAGGGSPATLGLVTQPSFTDSSVTTGQAYSYAIQSVDTSFNRSDATEPVPAVAQLRTVTVTFTVTVPNSTDDTGRAVHLAGSLDTLGTGLPSWDPTAGAMTRVDATHWTMTLSGPEDAQLQYKYALGDWDHVEKDAACAEIANRSITLTYGPGGDQAVADTVQNWRNVAPCGN
jgi:glycosidase